VLQPFSLIRVEARKYIDFLQINTLHAFSDMLYTLLIILLLSNYFGGVVVGFYAFTVRILKVPVGVIGSSLSQVFFQRASEQYTEKKKLYPLVKKAVFTLILTGFPLFLCIFLFGEDLFRFAFGEDWNTAGKYARILTPWLFIGF